MLTNDLVQCIIVSSNETDHVVCQSAEGKNLKAKIMGVGNMKPHSIDTRISKDVSKIFIAASSISQVEPILGCNGFLTYEIDCNALKMSAPRKYPFSEQYIEFMKEIGAVVKEKKNTFVYDLIPMIVELEQGKIAIVASSERTVSKTVHTNLNGSQTGYGTGTTTYTGPLITFFPDEKGASFTHSIIPTKFEYYNELAPSPPFLIFVSNGHISKSNIKFIALNQGNEVLIVYNTLAENLNLQDLTKLKTAMGDRNLILAETTVGADSRIAVSQQIGEDPKGKYSYLIGKEIATNSSTIIFAIGKERPKWSDGLSSDIFSHWCFINTNFTEMPSLGGGD